MTAQLVQDLSNDDYHAHKAASRTVLMELQRSPKKYHYKYLSGEYEDEDTTALKIGSAFHTLILEPEDFSKKAVIVPDGKRRPTKSQINAKNPSDSTLLQIEWWKKFDEEHDGKAYLSQADADNLKGMAAAIRSEPAAQRLLGKKGLIEPSIFWTDEDTGIECKVKLDFVPTDYEFVFDAKTTADVSADKFRRSLGEYGYDLQAYMNMEAVFQLTGERPDAFFFGCVEKKPPFDTGFYMADDDVIRSGEVKFRYLLRKLAKCRLNDHYPSNGDGKIRPIGLAPWDLKKIEEMETE